MNAEQASPDQSKAHTQKESDRHSHWKHADKNRILVVDDEKTIRDVFYQILSYGLPHCRVDMVVNGAEAVEAFRDVHHGLLLMDLRMPIMDGETAFHEIRKLCESENWEMPAVVFCTGYVPSQLLQATVEKDPVHCILQKPIDNDLLLRTLKARLALRG